MDTLPRMIPPPAPAQPLHSDTPYQKVPGLFCMFLALQDVSFSMCAARRPGSAQRAWSWSPTSSLSLVALSDPLLVVRTQGLDHLHPRHAQEQRAAPGHRRRRQVQ